MIWVHEYELVALRPLSARATSLRRRGALLRSAGVPRPPRGGRGTPALHGFADIHPWPELGDAPLDDQLASIAAGTPTPLAQRSLHFASLDGAARAEGRSLFEGLTIPESHYTYVGGEVPPEFDTVKVKMPCALPDRVLRLDFNSDGTAFERWLASRDPALRVDFVEDPVPYDASVWSELRARTGLRLAVDRGVGLEGADVLVVKPALQEVPATDKEIVVTSYMDHPVGQLFAAYVAATTKTSARCGLATHLLFEPNAFTPAMDGARLLPPPGTGIGFDDLLEALPWKRV